MKKISISLACFWNGEENKVEEGEIFTSCWASYFITYRKNIYQVFEILCCAEQSMVANCASKFAIYWILTRCYILFIICELKRTKHMLHAQRLFYYKTNFKTNQQPIGYMYITGACTWINTKVLDIYFSQCKGEVCRII